MLTQINANPNVFVNTIIRYINRSTIWTDVCTLFYGLLIYRIEARRYLLNRFVDIRYYFEKTAWEAAGGKVTSMVGSSE